MTEPSTPTNEGARCHVPELDGMRGVAVLLVVVLHCVVGLIKTTPGTIQDGIKHATMPFLVGGVDLFFVLSGFLIGGILMDSRQATNYFPVFWTRRIARIFPVYYLMFGISVLLTYLNKAVMPGAFNSLVPAPGATKVPLWIFATYTQNIWTALTHLPGVTMLGVTWSLAIEEQFYLALPLLVFFLPRRRLAILAATVIILTPFVRALVWASLGWYSSYVLTTCRLDALMMGVLVAITVRNPGWLSIAGRLRAHFDVVVIGLALLTAFDAFNLLSAPLIRDPRLHLAGYVVSVLRYPALSLAMALCLLRLFTTSKTRLHSALRMPPFCNAGLVSYAVYMFHQPVNFWMFHVLRGSSPALSGWGDWYIPVAVIAVTFALATVSYFVLEMPIRRLGARAQYRFQSRADTQERLPLTVS